MNDVSFNGKYGILDLFWKVVNAINLLSLKNSSECKLCYC